MKTTLKKVLSIALALVLLVGVLPMAALAETGENDDTTRAHFHHSFALGRRGTEINAGTCQTKATYKAKCDSCDYESATRTVEGDLNPDVHEYDTTTLYKDENKHWYACPCGAKDEAAHNGVTPATCTSKAICSTCGEFGEQPDGHSDITPATCHSYAICGVCEQPASTEYAADNHTAADPTKWEHDVNYHWNVCGCANHEIVNKGRHEWPSDAARTTREACIVCGVERDIPNNKTPDDNEGGNGSTGGTTTEVANLHIKENGVLKYSTTGTPNGPVSVADCLSIAGINSANVTNITVSGNQSTTLNGTFTLGAANTTTTIEFTTATPTQQYMVRYNLNVNSSANNDLGYFYEGTSMDVVLNSNTLKNAKHPGYFSNWYHLEGWYLDSNCTIKATGTVDRAGIVLYAKWARNYNYNVYLKIYTNGVSTNLVRIEDMFNYAQDQVITLDEVKSVVNAHIKSNNDAPLTSYGPFLPDDWELYLRDNHKLNIAEKVTVYNDRDTVLYVMVHNAQINGSTSSSGSKADSSNPKTGDMIMVPAAVMGTTVSALAVMFYLKKKRTV